MRLSKYNTLARVGDHTYVHSGLGGGFHRIANDKWKRVVAFTQDLDGGDGIEDQLKDLVEARVLTADDVDELDVLEARYTRSRHGGGLGLTIVTSLGCNFDCPYCFESKHPSLLKPDVAKALVGLVDEGIAAGIPSVAVTWMGGEPLLGSKQLFHLSNAFIERCAAANIPYQAHILTNGWHLTRDMAQRLAAVGVGRAQVTIDGPADIHDKYRPKKEGGTSFDRIVTNVSDAIEYLGINIRVNLDTGNLGRVEELMVILAERGLAGKVSLTPARLAPIASAPDAPALSYAGGCYGCGDYANVELEFDELADRHGFTTRGLPRAIGSPCSAVRSTDLVVGSDGELWKCWDDIGSADEIVGTIFEYHTANDKLLPWMAYDPFQDEDCRNCIALPGCMGGCAHHEFFGSRDDRCGSFRFNHQEKVENEARRLDGKPPASTGLGFTRESQRQAATPLVAVPVTLSRKSVEAAV